eukprot:COSAG06_NODE_918_length_11551_cov_4.681802_16_plen_62_part_00
MNGLPCKQRLPRWRQLHRQQLKGRHRKQRRVYSRLQLPFQHQWLHQRLHHHQQLLHSLWLQ